MDIFKISNTGSSLDISFTGLLLTALETIFMIPEDLEKIILQDESDNTMSVFKNFTILKSIKKDKNVELNAVTEAKADIVTITLEQEPEWAIENRKLKEQLALQDGAIMDLGTVVSTITEVPFLWRKQVEEATKE